MNKQYVYISQEDLDKFSSVLRRGKINQKDAFGIPLEFAVDFWGKDSPRGKMAMAQQGFNIEGNGSIDFEIESAIFSVIKEQKERKTCFSNLGETMEGMSSDEDFFIRGSFKMSMNYGSSSPEFIQLENNYTPCFYNEKKMWVRIVMGMSVSKMLVSLDELQDKIIDNSLDIWGRIYKFDNGFKPPSFQFKPFVVGFNWISSIK
ncbi:MAG: hypothetical protein FWH29_09440 [Methanobrevibacter sp.]|nr:hypothetical protein [Methanobrevibacter sp.]